MPGGKVENGRPPVAHRQPTIWTRRRLGIAGALLVLAGAAAAPLSALFTGNEASIAPPDSVAVVDPATNRVSATVAVGGAPQAVAVAPGGVWVANTGNRTVSRIDTQALRVVRTIRLGPKPSGVVVAATSVAVVSGPSGRIVWIDPSDDRTTRALAFGGCGDGPVAAAAGEGSFWLVCDRTAAALRIRLSPLGVTQLKGGLLGGEGAVAPHFSAVAFGDGRVWIADRALSRVIEVDPVTSRAVRQVAVGNEPAAVAVGFDSVWVANRGNGTVTRIQLGAGARPVKTQPISVGEQPVDIATGEGSVWVANSGSSSISRIDPRANEVTATIRLGNPPTGVATGAGHVWVTVDR